MEHIKLEDGRITYASKELVTVLLTMYFGFQSAPVMSSVNPNHLADITAMATKGLTEVGLTWDNIPEDKNDWGVVSDHIDKIKKGDILWNSQELLTHLGEQ